MTIDLADELERLIEQDAVWESGALGRCAQRLLVSPAEPAASLARCFSVLEGRLEEAPGDDRMRRDVEGVLYPRLWKVVEAVRDGLPCGELLNRVRALDRRLTELLDGGPA
ncbi:MAG: hypothetical protein ACRD0O_20820 [Acidimicrobiia bacterium]